MTILQRTRPILLLLSVLLIGNQAFCWGVTGHRVVAEIAQHHLSKKTRKEISKLLDGQSLATWANWPDFIKSDKAWDEAYSWHYIDLPAHATRDQVAAILDTTTSKSLYSQIQVMVKDLGNRSLSVEKRRIALYFLIHFIGDLHQPLHVGRAGTEGGNKIPVYWFDAKTNLHTVWDSRLIDFQQYSYTEYAAVLDFASDQQVKQWQSTTLVDNFYESHNLADSIYDATPDSSKLKYDYNYKFVRVLDQQLLKGGIRLAGILNGIFD